MVRIDRERIEKASAPVIETIPTRFDDLDVQGHINNSATIVILQEARARFNAAIGLGKLNNSERAMVAGLQVEFARQLYHPDPIEVSTAIVAVGRTSFVMGQVARQNGNCAVYAETAIVMTDENGPTPLSNTMREAYLARCSTTA